MIGELLDKLGHVNAVAARAKETAGRLRDAANSQDGAKASHLAQLAAHIGKVGVGADPAAEEAYCHGLVDRHRLNQVHTLCQRDADRLPDVEAPRALAKGLAAEYVPPEMPRWRKRPQGSEGRYLPLNGIEDRDKYRGFLAALQDGTFDWSVPLVRCGDQLLTGSHRYAAAKEAGKKIPTITIEQVFRESGLDFKSLYRQVAEPWSGWLNNMAHTIEFLPPEVREKYGLELG